jgi:hypothetical protein
VSVAAWDTYAGTLAVWGDWAPDTTSGRDLLLEARESPTTANVARQAVEQLRVTYSTLPPEVRGAVMDALRLVSERISEGMEALEMLGDAPIVGWVVAGIQVVVQIQQGFAGVADVKRSASNYEHGNGQWSTAYQAAGQGGTYEIVRCKEYAQFVRYRLGGDFDRKPCFTRRGGERDGIFMGTPSPPDNPGKCKKQMGRDAGDSYGPFEGNKCGRRLGISALFWPWWSAAYAPMLLPRWQGSPPGASFQAGPSEDTNALLAGVQMGLLSDPRKNLAHSFWDVTNKSDRFLAWFMARADLGGVLAGVMPLDSDYFVEPSGVRKTIDAARDLGHVSSPDAKSFWYFDTAGVVRAYPDQEGSRLDRWGVALPPGDPEGLGVSLGQYNAVVSARAGFAQRRLATLRNVSLVKAAVAELGLVGIDPPARAAVEYASGLSSTAGMLPYPGESQVKLGKVRVQKLTKRATVRKSTIKPAGMSAGARVALGVVTVAGVGLLGAGAAGLLPIKK